MASFSAELHVAGHVIPLIRCTYDARQATDARGRVLAHVRHSSVAGEADVPDHQALEAWAADPLKRQAASLIFRHADTGITSGNAATARRPLHGLQRAVCAGRAR
jgi:hypothetical protein